LGKTIVDNYSEKPDGFPVNVASAFCGGVGRTHQDICGAFTGAIIAIGYLYGRTEQGMDLTETSSIASEFRRQFLETFSSNNCAVLRDRLGEQEGNIKCKQLTARATGILADIMDQARRNGK